MKLKQHFPKIVAALFVLSVIVVVVLVLLLLRNQSFTPTQTQTPQAQVLNPEAGEDQLANLTSQTLDVPAAYAQGVFASPITMTLPAKDHISVYAAGMNGPRFFTFDSQDRMYVAEMTGGRLLMIKDENGDGIGDSVEQVDVGLNNPSSVAFYQGDLYVGTESQIIVYHNMDNGKFAGKEVIVPDLPTGGHATRTVVIGPDQKLYVSIGSSCNLCQESDDRRAAVVQYELDGTQDEVYATGLRNSVGLTFKQNASGEFELWSVDNGRDNLGDDLPPEEVNILHEGKDYGWPYCYGSQIANPEYASSAVYCQKQSEAPAYEMQAHSAPLGIAFGPNDLQNQLFIAFHGSWNRSTPTGYKLVRINTAKEGATVEDFLTGFVDAGGNVWGRPVGVGFDANGAMYVSDDKAGAIYRITQTN